MHRFPLTVSAFLSVNTSPALPFTLIATSLRESLGVHAICRSEDDFQHCCLSYNSYATPRPCYTVTMDASDQNPHAEAHLPPRPLLQPIQNEAVPQSGDVANITFQHSLSPRRATQVNVNIPCTMQAVKLIQERGRITLATTKGQAGYNSLWYIQDSASECALHGSS